MKAILASPHIRKRCFMPVPYGSSSSKPTIIAADHDGFCNAARCSPVDFATLREPGRLLEAELVAMNFTTHDALTGVSNLRGFLIRSRC